MTNRLYVLVAACVLAFSGSSFAGPVPGQGTWETTLQPRDLDGDGKADAFYDTTLNITWLANANAGAGSLYDDAASPTDGLMTWLSAVNWAANLNVSGVTGWRLPRMVDSGTAGCDYAFSGTDCGYNVQTASGSTVYSEIAHLFYVTLGNKAFYDTEGNQRETGYGWTNTANFTNVNPNYYWFGTEYALDPSSYAWFFVGDGSQNRIVKWADFFSAWAVHDGDVGRRYTFSGFLPPINLPPTVNTGKAGRSFPLKWTLADAQGATVSDLGVVKSITYKESPCSPFTTDPTGASAASPPGHSQLSYDQSAQQYQFNWKSPSTPGCYVLFLMLSSGQFFGANVMLR